MGKGKYVNNPQPWVESVLEARYREGAAVHRRYGVPPERQAGTTTPTGVSGLSPEGWVRCEQGKEADESEKAVLQAKERAQTKTWRLSLSQVQRAENHR